MKGEDQMLYLPGQKKIIDRRLQSASRRWFFAGILIGILVGVISGYYWCVKVNIDDLTEQVNKERALVEELKKGYVPPRPERRG